MSCAYDEERKRRGQLTFLSNSALLRRASWGLTRCVSAARRGRGGEDVRALE